MLTSIDLSNNKFEGEIPKVIEKLNSLKGLNLSHNNLTGWEGSTAIARSDISLSLNLSEKELVGCIPRGKQFNTFENNSYEGNEGLRGFPLSSDCINNVPPQPPPSNSLEEEESKSIIAFGWKIVLTGYCCGVLFGLAVGYVVFRTGKPKWIVSFVENQHHKRRKKSKIGNRSGGERRT
ncbi:hypothetical protein CRYUN_Cryun25bG0008100 [Craigia yunnanensis]